ncbi:MAG: Fe2+-dependent dioxygenase [Halofilum sp. (in: g-proteobacteria)]|nr:Fe2+-dependent dioxygenase [Halofilum sp. (in: g-proteobacteria)]
MILCIGEVLDDEALQRVRGELEQVEFRDGRETAGWHARTVKRNTQASGRDARVARLRDEIGATLERHALFNMATRPRRITPVLFSRYEPGMEYGAHVDDAVMNSPEGPIRTDISFTLFLCDPDDYDGGELVTDTTAGEQSWKLPAGALVLYPSSTLHRVNPVARGQRVAAVGWVQSQVRDPAQREILFDLDTTRRRLFDEQGKTETFDTISKSLANLTRMWAEP